MKGHQPVAVMLVLACVVALAACDDDGNGEGPRPSTTSQSTDSDEVQASASFDVTLGDQSGSFDYSQSEVTPSTIAGTPQVPVSLHAAAADNPLDEFTISGRVEEGEHETSDAVVLGIGVSLEPSSALFVSDDGTCTITVDELSDTRISGSFTCDADYGGEPFTAAGTFEAR